MSALFVLSHLLTLLIGVGIGIFYSKFLVKAVHDHDEQVDDNERPTDGEHDDSHD